MRKLHYLLALSVVLCGAVSIFSGCDSNNAGDSSIQVLLTDAPRDDFAEANIIIERVELRGDNGRYMLLADFPQPFDLLTLQNGATAVLVDDFDIPDGIYNQIRIEVNEEAQVVYNDGTKESLKVPSGSIKIPLPELAINDDVILLTIDFDVDRSFVKRGNSGKGYIFKPALKPTTLLINGEAINIDDFDDFEDD